jgi:phosphoglycerate dehydrogenase-like enzyme
MADPTNLLIVAPFEDAQIAALRKRFPSVNINHHPNIMEETIPEDLWQNTDILYTHRVLPLAELAPNLRWVQFHYAGLDAYQDHALFQREDLQFTTLSGANAIQTAEHALALILALAHNVPTMLSDQSRSKWSARRLERYVPTELYGKTVGIVGYGSVGTLLARMLQGFQVKVLASKRELLDAEDEGYRGTDIQGLDADFVERLYPGRAMKSMFKDCDFVVITVPLTNETEGLVSGPQLAALPPSAFLVDVSRGGVLDHVALIEALKQETFAGAALDVFPEEPLPADSPLWDMPNVLISPHVAGLSPNYGERAMALLTENLDRFLAGEELLNRYDSERGY